MTDTEMKHLGTVKLETKRLVLRRFEYADSEAAFRNWTGDPRVTEFLRWKKHSAISETQSLARFWDGKYSDPKWYHWAIVPKDIGEAVGTISAAIIYDDTDTIEVGYCIGSRYWHQGYTSEALAALIAFAFTTLEAGRVEAMHDPANRYSGKVMEKCGMRHEGTLRKADWSNRGIVDAAVYGILREEFRD